MPRASRHLQLLRGLTKEELQRVPDRCDWCNVREVNVPASDLSKRIRDSIERNTTQEDFTYEDAMADIRRNVLIPGPETVTQKIRNTLRETPVARSVGGGSNAEGSRESWFTAQLYGSLSTGIVRPYTVKLEYELNHTNRPTVDIYVESDNNRGDYVIEIKRLSANLEGPKIGRQLKKYHRAIKKDRQRTRERTFLCIVGEVEDVDLMDASLKSTPISEYTDIPKTVDNLEEELERVEVIANIFR